MLYSSFITSLKSRSVVGSNAMIILECANILGSCALKYPRTTRPRVNRISFLPCDNASSGVIAPRCVYIDGISMASKEFVSAVRSRYLIYRGAFGTDENKKRANINLQPEGCCRLRHSTLVLSNHPFVRAHRGEHRCHNPHARHHLITSVSLSFPVMHGTSH